MTVSRPTVIGKKITQIVPLIITLILTYKIQNKWYKLFNWLTVCKIIPPWKYKKVKNIILLNEYPKQLIENKIKNEFSNSPIAKN